jgi:hypothetical protein
MDFLITCDPVDRYYRLIPPSFLPCKAWHENRVTIAHHEEVGVSADGYASGNPSGATAAATPAGTATRDSRIVIRDATIPVGEIQTSGPRTAFIYPTSYGPRRPTDATHLGRSFPTSSENYANLAPRP